MTAADHERISELFVRVRELEPDARTAFLAELDDEVRAELESLLEYEPLIPEPEELTAAAAPSRLRAGAAFGDYVLIGELGRGGMGIVWEAEQVSLQRRVALKILPFGLQASHQGVLRFQREARAGGRSRHPGIVAVYAAGEVDGVPFIAQELVEGGRTLSDRFAELRGMTELPKGYYRELALFFRSVADALQTAHDSGVEHRDVKPSNILIAFDGSPKVADFGLAHVEDALGLSRSGDLLGTPFYMSPEQAASKRGGIDHRSDVFSLGATMYEALTLVRPFDGDTSHQVLERVLVAEPVDPRRLRSRIPGELAVVCLKALEKNRERRYQSMAEFADDIGRYLASEPIHARSPGVLRRSRKWLARHPTASALIVTGVVALAIISGLLLSNVRALRDAEVANAELDRANVELTDARDAAQASAVRAAELARQAEDEATKARRAAETSENVVEFLTGMFRLQKPERARGATVTVKEVLDREADRIGSELADDPEVKARLIHAMGSVYHSLGLFEEAEPLLADAVGLRAELLGEEHVETLATVNDLVGVLLSLGRQEEAERLARRAADSLEAQLGEDDPNTLTLLNTLGNVYMAGSRFAEAEPILVRVLAARRRVLGNEDPVTLNSINNLALLYEERGRHDEAEALHAEALATRRRTLGDDAPATLTSLNNLANVYIAQSRHAEAEPLLLEALAQRRRVLGERHKRTLTTLATLAYLYDDLRRYEEAEERYVGALDGFRETLGDDHPSTLGVMNNLAGLYHTRGRRDEAERLYLETLAGRRERLGRGHRYTLNTVHNLALIYKQQGRYADAEELYFEALEGLVAVVGDDHPDAFTFLANLAALYAAQGRDDEAEPLYHEALDGHRRHWGDRHPHTLQSMAELGEFYRKRGRIEEARPLFGEALALHRERGAKDARFVRTLRRMVSLTVDAGELDAAEELLVEALEVVRSSAVPDDETTFALLADLGSVCYDRGDYERSVAFYSKALEGQRLVLGADRRSTLMTMNNLAGAYSHLRRFDEAEPLYRNVLEALRRTAGERDPQTLATINNLGDLCEDAGRLEEAEALYLEATDGSLEALGAKHPYTLGFQTNLARLYVKQGRFEDALPLARGLVARTTQGDPRRPDRVRMLEELEARATDE